MSLVVLCDICGEVDKNLNSGDTCGKCNRLGLIAYDKAKRELIEKYDKLEKCVMLIGPVLVSVQRSHPDHWRKTWNDQIGDLMDAALKEYDSEPKE